MASHKQYLTNQGMVAVLPILPLLQKRFTQEFPPGGAWFQNPTLPSLPARGAAPTLWSAQHGGTNTPPGHQHKPPGWSQPCITVPSRRRARASRNLPLSPVFFSGACVFQSVLILPVFKFSQNLLGFLVV